jgi:hypothetical protein
VALVALAVAAYFVVPVSGQVDQSAAVRLLFGGVTLCALTAVILWQLARQRDDPEARVDGLVLALVVAILAFALGFYRMATVDPSEIVGLRTRVDALYFTMSTLLTIGYGDVHAAGQAARGVVLVQMVFNAVVLATAATALSSRIRARAVARTGRRLRRREQALPTAPGGGSEGQGRVTRRKRGR